MRAARDQQIRFLPDPRLSSPCHVTTYPYKRIRRSCIRGGADLVDLHWVCG